MRAAACDRLREWADRFCAKGENDGSKALAAAASIKDPTCCAQFFSSLECRGCLHANDLQGAGASEHTINHDVVQFDKAEMEGSGF